MEKKNLIESVYRMMEKTPDDRLIKNLLFKVVLDQIRNDKYF